MRCENCGRENMTGTTISCICGDERCPYCGYVYIKSKKHKTDCCRERNILTPFWDSKELK